MISIREAAEAIGASVRTVQRLCSVNKMGARFGSQFVLTTEDVDALRGLFRGRPGNPNFGDPDSQAAFLATRKIRKSGKT